MRDFFDLNNDGKLDLGETILKGVHIWYCIDQLEKKDDNIIKEQETNDMIEYHLIRSRRKTVGLSVNENAELVVRAPLRTSVREINRIILENDNWISKKKEQAEERKRKREEQPQMSKEELNRLAEKALKIIPERVAYYAPIVGVSYGRITIRNQRTLWGSCSSKGNLNFNVMLMKVPPELLDYVVVHELCHRLEMNHSPRFWNEVERVLPDGREREKKMKEYGYLLQGKSI